MRSFRLFSRNKVLLAARAACVARHDPQTRPRPQPHPHQQPHQQAHQQRL